MIIHHRGTGITISNSDGESRPIKGEVGSAICGLVIQHVDGRHEMIGSAFFIAPGVAATAKHIVSDHIDLEAGGMQERVWLISPQQGRTPYPWYCESMNHDEGSDLLLLYVTPKVVDRREVINPIIMTSPMMPEMGDMVHLVGARQTEVSRESKVGSYDILACSGYVTECFPVRRERSMLSSPSFHVDCVAKGGMSGGAATSGKDGRAVGVVSTSMEIGDTGISGITTFAALNRRPIYPDFPKEIYKSNTDGNIWKILNGMTDFSTHVEGN